MEWSFRLPTRRLTRARKQVRSSLGNALLKTSFPSLIVFRIKVDDKDSMDETDIVESLMSEDEEEDTLSLGVRCLCQLPNLRRLHLKTLWTLSPVAFGSLANQSDIHYPSLEYLHIDCSMTTPDAKYLLTRDQSRALADDSGYGIEHDEKIAAFDSDDSDISDFLPDFE
ncbi:hypothetical protein CPAR01_03312 [Colletotrichum paranaense]|uniref:F-box domain-containing protein n=1 Tax=Colletotrichum paranaense TaxID=1914294 RepID=A0ABQ9T2K5_9PEZI|nr:uncharacterized protein CPAR01_03312 [Colletotrichum paranaense]KAK1545810.1 hypothetical protein CPAR01_03312 [Colletotrichum paranaense]